MFPSLNPIVHASAWARGSFASVLWRGIHRPMVHPLCSRLRDRGVIVDDTRCGPVVDALWNRASGIATASPLTESAFVDALVHAIGTDDATVVLATLHIEDLLLARACLAGDAAGLRFVGAAFDEVSSRLRRKDPGAFIDDALQIVKTRLLVGEAPRLTQYRGRGPLLGFVHVAAAREALTQRPGDLVHDDDDAELNSLIDTSDDSEMQVLKKQYGAELRVAFREATARLSADERLLLRQSVVDGLGIDVLANIHGVHRATVARRLEAIRDRLADDVRTALRDSLGCSDETVQSVLRMVRSRVDLSLQKVLR